MTTDLAVAPAPGVGVILVGPRGGANVGAVCRAMKNMGAGRLITVSEEFDIEQARRMAVHAADVLEARLCVEDLPQALGGYGLVVGTTARSGAQRLRATAIRQVAADLVSWQAGGETAGDALPLGAALVFGPEDRGLSNEEIARCHHLAFIPTTGEYGSLNLAQAVLLCLYEVFLARLAAAGMESGALRPAARDAKSGYPPADAAAVESMFVDLEDALIRIGFLAEDHPGQVMATVRGLLARAGIDERELRVLRGISRQMRWYAEGGHEVAADKRGRGVPLR